MVSSAQVLSSATLVPLIELLTWPQSPPQQSQPQSSPKRRCQRVVVWLWPWVCVLSLRLLLAVVLPAVILVVALVIAVVVVVVCVADSCSAGRLLTLFRPRLQQVVTLLASTNLIIHKSVKIVDTFGQRK